jgi:Uncharacterized protein with conserved CXXC pairs
MQQSVTCINCPVGCRMTVELSDSGEFVSVSGNTCPRGAAYARQECTAPTRMITAVIPLENRSTPLSVKTSVPVPKDRIAEIMRELSQVRVSAPVRIGQIVVKNILHTDADIIATRAII